MDVRVTLPQRVDWKAQVRCQAGCPVATDAGPYVQLVAEGRLEEAYLAACAPNPFASVCGRLCAAPCEDLCRLGAIDAPIAIRAGIFNPVDAARTAALTPIEGTAAFGSASLALRLTGRATAAVALAIVSVLFWTVAPLSLAVHRLRRADI